MPLIIGFTGKAGSGKGECCNIIQKLYSPCNVFPMAGELKRIAREEFDWNGEKDDKGRKLLQRIGTEIGRECCGEDFWVNKWERCVNEWVKKILLDSSIPNKDPLVLCDDVRFDNEAQRIKDLGGIVIEIQGRSYDLGNNSNHASERGVGRRLINHIIDNSSDYENLVSQTKEFLNQYTGEK